MEFLENMGESFLFYFVLFMVIAVVAIVFRTIRNKQKEKGFRSYLAQKFPALDQNIPILMAKSESKKVKPDLCLLIDGENQHIIVLRNVSGKVITHKLYSTSNLTALNRTNQMISRGFAPKTWSYEECLEVVFADGNQYKFYLENISNREGTDAGADAVRETFKPWIKILAEYLPK